MAPEGIEIHDLLKAFIILNIIPIILFALGASYLEQSLAEMIQNDLEIDRSSEIERIRFLSLIVVLVQFSIFLGAGEVREAFPIQSQLIFILSSLAQFLLQTATEKKLLPPAKTSVSAIGLMARIITSSALSVLTYFFAVSFSIESLAWISTSVFGFNHFPQFSLQVRSFFIFFSSGFGVVLGLMLSYLLGPLHLKILFPSQEIQNQELKARIFALFKEQKLKIPSIRIIESEQFKFFPILFSGAQLGKGPLRPILYLTEGVLKDLTPQELKALISVEMSKVLLSHQRKRLIYSLLLIFACLLTAIPVIGFSSTFFSQEVLVSRIIPATTILGFLFCFSLVFRQTKRHTFEADLYSIEKLSLSPEDLLTAIRKTHPEGHPTRFEAEHRIQLIKKILSKTPSSVPEDFKKAS